MSTFNSRRLLNHLLTYTLPPPTESQIEDNRPQALTLLRQLDLIDRTSEGFDAMSDYLQSITNKVRWGEKGLVCEQDFQEFGKTLLNKWTLLNKKTSMSFSGASELDRGQLLHMECMDVTENLDGTESPRFFVRGTYHQFSNLMRIGWHPRFTDLLDK
jgi:hypothetical protein